MLARIPGQVVLHIGHGVVHGVVPGEELVTQGDVVVVVLEDVDVREFLGIGTADIVQLGEGSQELVGQVVGQTAVQIQRPRVHHIVHGVHVVGIGHGVLAHTAAAHTGTAVHGRGVRAVPDIVDGIVVPQGQVVLLADVPVQAGQDLGIALIGREVRIGTGLILVVAVHEIADGLQVLESGPGDVVIWNGHPVFRPAPTVHHRRNLGILRIHEKEQLVLDDGTAQRESIGGGTVDFPGTGNLLAIYGVALHVLVLVIHVSGSSERIGTGFRDGVDTTADEVGLPHVIRADDHLQFLDGVDRNRVAAAGEAGGQSEVVVEVGAVHGKVGGTAVGTRETHAAASVRRQTGNVRNVAVHRRDGLDLLVVDVGHGTRLFHGGELGSRRSDYHGLGKELVGFVELCIQVVGLSQGKCNLRVIDLLVTQAGHFDPVGTAGTHALDGVKTVHVGHGAVAGAGRFVDGHDSGADHRLAVLVHDPAAEGRRRHLREGSDACEHRDEHEQKAFEGISHKVIVIN